VGEVPFLGRADVLEADLVLGLQDVVEGDRAGDAAGADGVILQDDFARA
jgi:hypothetical protein